MTSSTSTPYAPLTASGRGARIADRSFNDFTVAELQTLLDRYLWLAFEKHPVTGDDVLKKLGEFGPLIENERRQAGVLKIDGTKKDEVLLGQGFMPLHRDGALMGTNVKTVGIYCVEYQNVTEGGRTFITDIDSAMKQIPKDIIDLVRERGIEAKPVDQYYLKASDQWHAIPGFITVDGKEYLNVGFPFEAHQKPSWIVRIPGVDDDRFEAIFKTLRSAMMDERYCYFHNWTQGDLLLFDNRKTLHGREAFAGQRNMANIQVNGAAA